MMDISGITNQMINNAAQKADNSSAKKVSAAANSLSANSSDEELLDAIKDFESYFMEKILKEVKDTMTKWGEDKDTDPMNQLTDFYMDTVYEKLADNMLDDIGGNFTQQLFEQMKRNYNIPTVDTTETTEE